MKNFFKKMIALLITTILLLSFSSCSTNNIEVNVDQDSETYIANEDFQNYLNSFSAFVKVDGGYYFLSDCKLYFYDTVKNQAYPVCNKANCKHEGSDCLAYLSPLEFYAGMSLHYYDNALYLLGYEQEGNAVYKNYMYQISLDNFKRKKAAYLFESSGQISTLFMIHRGYVYFTHGESPMKEATAVLYRTKLGNTSSDAPEIVYEFDGIGADIATLSAYGNYMLFNTTSFEDPEGNGYKVVTNYIDIHTLKNQTISNIRYAHFADEGKVYYFKDNKIVECYDLKTKKAELFCNIDGPCYISADSNYIYFDSRQKMYTDESFTDRKIYVYDKSGKYITEITPKNPKDDCYFGGDDIMIFKEVTVTNEAVESEGLKGYYILDKSQLTSSDKQFIDME